jgi:hypothetical protein
VACSCPSYLTRACNLRGRYWRGVRAVFSLNEEGHSGGCKCNWNQASIVCFEAAVVCFRFHAWCSSGRLSSVGGDVKGMRFCPKGSVGGGDKAIC